MNISPIRGDRTARDIEDASRGSNRAGTPPDTPPSTGARKSPRCARPMRLNCLGWHLSSIWRDEHGAPGASDGPRLAAPNPFAAQDTTGNEPMPTASPTDSAAPAKGQAARVTAAPVLPQPPRFADRTMEQADLSCGPTRHAPWSLTLCRRNGGDAHAMPVGACIEGRTKRMIARYEFGIAPERVSEE
ncbi:hypothetical protein GQ600_14646 [Phytophthora cactorum]|nr:hypothetical protein GQ600_14646 [Phytophthora cactorum]